MKKNVRRIMLIVWIVIIFVLTGYPKLEVPELMELPIDKLYHFVVFFVMGLLAAKLMRAKGFFILGFVIVLLAELQQLVIPGREFEPLDIAAGILALIVSYFVFREKGMKSELSKA
ncbi:VanZ family protein [candidate division WOR-3 bacterium]|nr:VanZ family protein [candidate division WOR-3 bacterium]